MSVFFRIGLTLSVGLLPTILSLPVHGQVRIQACPGIAVPEQKVTVLFNVVCRVVAEEFHLGDVSELHVPVTLVVGTQQEGVVGDETSQVFTIYMQRWDESLFAASASRIALQHLLSCERKAHIVGESLRRANLVLPISLDALHPVTRRHSELPELIAPPPVHDPAAFTAAQCLTSLFSPSPGERSGTDRATSQPPVNTITGGFVQNDDTKLKVGQSIPAFTNKGRSYFLVGVMNN